MSKLPAIWSGTEELIIPSDAINIEDFLPLAAGLTKKQQKHIIQAFNGLKAYDMAVEFAWSKAISRLKETLASLGMQFIGEMLGRTEITDTTPYETVLTAHETIQLSEQLGLISSTAGLQLRQSNELITHYLSSKAIEELDGITALNVIKNSIKYVLGHEDMTVAMEFISFRKKLLDENLKKEDPQIDLLIHSPVFYAKTVCFILLNSIKKDQGAKIEHALANLNLILPMIWKKFGDAEKWNVGFAYRDVVANNNTTAANGLKQALMKVAGFDFVPESLRSNTFVKAAKNVIEVHYSFDNFHNEPAAVRGLVSLGSTIPKPAFLHCMQAFLLICVGNIYGVSNIAFNIVEEQLGTIPEERWRYYFEKGINNDEEVLYNLRSTNQVGRLTSLLSRLGLNHFKELPIDNQRLYDAIINGRSGTAISLARSLYTKMKI